MKSINTITIYEIDGTETHDDLKLTVENHWNRKSFVVLKYKGLNITVARDELERATQNATNSHTF